MKKDKSYKKLLLKISGNIKKYRKENNLTQEDMADYGFNYKHYQRLESGRHSMSLQTLYKLTKIFNISLNKLLK